MKIISAALKLGEVIISLPKPNRHHDLLRETFLATGDAKFGKDATQGFLTDQGTFLTREEAFRVAFEFGLFKWWNTSEDRTPPRNSGKLYSEDLW